MIKGLSYTFAPTLLLNGARRSAAAALLLLSSSLALAAPVSNDAQTLPESLFAIDSSVEHHSCSWEQRISTIIERLIPGATLRSVSHTPRSLQFELPISKNSRRLQFSLIDITQANAYALPASDSAEAEIVLTSGLLEEIQTDSELAFVLAHELAHIEDSHFPLQAPTLLLNSKQIAHIQNVHQSWELLADRKAVAILEQSGFHSLEAIALLRRLERHSPQNEPRLLQAHPGIEVRLRALRERITHKPFLVTHSLGSVAISEQREARYARR